MINLLNKIYFHNKNGENFYTLNSLLFGTFYYICNGFTFLAKKQRKL